MQYGKKPKNNMRIPNHIQFDTVSPATKLLEKRRQMYEVHEAFEAQRHEFKSQEESFKRQEALIRERDLSIQEDLIKFCKFLSDNDQKKQRAEQRYIDEGKNVRAREVEIDELNTQLDDLQKDSTRLEKKVVALKKYEDYLELVNKKYSEQYSDLMDILSRYQSLDQANKNLRKNHEKVETQLENLRNDLTQFEKEKTNEILLINNTTAGLQKDLEDKEANRQKLQNEVEASRNDASTLNLRLGKILMALDNIFERCVEGSHKLRYDFEETNEKERKTKAEKNEKNAMSKSKSPRKVDRFGEKVEESKDDNYHKKGEEALAKLKKIGNYLFDFNKNLNELRKEENTKKTNKKTQE